MGFVAVFLCPAGAAEVGDRLDDPRGAAAPRPVDRRLQGHPEAPSEDRYWSFLISHLNFGQPIFCSGWVVGW